jgi:hypothetical protein
MIFKTKEPPQEDYSRFVREGLTTWTEETPVNVRYPFARMSKLFGLSYIYWLEIQYRCLMDSSRANDPQAFDEICRWNGGVPASFFSRFK